MLSTDEQLIETHSRHGVWMVALTLVGAGLAYVTSILFARLLGPGEYEHYAVAVATLSLLVAFAEAGVGKFAMKVLPEYTVSQQWSLAAGYWRFSLLVVALTSLPLAVGIAIIEGWEDNEFGDYPLGIAVLFLPAVALSGVCIDMVMANRQAVTGMFIARVIVPGSTLAMLIAVSHWLGVVSPTAAINIYCGGSIVGMVCGLLAFGKSSPRAFFLAAAEYRWREWLPECFYFALFGFLISWTFKISLVVLEMLPIEAIEIARFAAAVETGSLILLLAKSTDKLFQPELSVVLTQGSWEFGKRLRRRRYALVGTGCALFMLTMVLFGRQILGLYGTQFEAGYPALCCISVGTCLTTLFSMAPVLLRYVNEDRILFGVTICGAVAMALLTAILAVWYGATGAGLAFGLVLSTTSLVFLVAANRLVRQLS